MELKSGRGCWAPHLSGAEFYTASANLPRSVHDIAPQQTPSCDFSFMDKAPRALKTLPLSQAGDSVKSV